MTQGIRKLRLPLGLILKHSDEGLGAVVFLGFRVYSLGFRGLGFRVWGLQV